LWEFAVLRTTTTFKNGGRQFWGCPKYKVRCIELWFMKKKGIGIDFLVIVLCNTE